MIHRWHDLGKYLIPQSLRTHVRNRILASTHAPNVWWSLQNLHRLGFCPTQIIDGTWTRRCKEIFPEARVLCIEPQQAKEPPLQQVRKEVPGMDYVMALVGKERKENVPLFVNETGTTFHSFDGEPNAVASMTTLDTLIESGHATPPQFVSRAARLVCHSLASSFVMAIALCGCLLLSTRSIGLGEDLKWSSPAKPNPTAAPSEGLASKYPALRAAMSYRIAMSPHAGYGPA